MHKVAVQSAVVPAAGPLDRTRVARSVDRRGARKPILSRDAQGLPGQTFACLWRASCSTARGMRVSRSRTLAQDAVSVMRAVWSHRRPPSALRAGWAGRRLPPLTREVHGVSCRRRGCRAVCGRRLRVGRRIRSPPSSGAVAATPDSSIRSSSTGYPCCSVTASASTALWAHRAGRPGADRRRSLRA